MNCRQRTGEMRNVLSAGLFLLCKALDEVQLESIRHFYHFATTMKRDAA